ncbi:MAG: CSLREA domain-containing protein, partial [Anaerolineales bacterium]|nr:CSLREA domain-containing protein [Anaerolineales bacterium]
MALSLRRGLALLALLLAAGAALARPAAAASFTVDSTLDAVDAAPGDGVCATAGAVCTLRAAIQEANALAGSDLIDFAVSGPFVLTLAGTGEDAAATGDLDIAPGGLTIAGDTAALSVIDGGALDRVFEVQASASLTLNDVTVRNGQSNVGGGLVSVGTLALNDVVVTGNQASLFGGGLYVAAGQTLITRALLSNNTAANDGGGLYLESGGVVRLVNVTVTGNTASGSGGGLFSNGAALVLFNV